MTSDRNGTSAAYARKENDYREKALKLYPWVCGNCAREFVYSNLSELTVHHKDHDHTNNPQDGSNWELLCLYCHDHEHSKYTDHERYGAEIVPGQNEHINATHNSFAELAKMIKK